ncbi:NAD dependent epimerase/dehydratase, putative [Talaromyces stipitatus ATCC 10500]|uniref:NAD dependent epimerase/dehydratase, putative n=1 Tax=Talaromyces stipitatus (strain ATCC 10500 / CBS 375.48 / QM 6759 / NRRL 1006) TaxID=441959 RepID=B8MDT8_TALSN|nr:NAD dependent epimerase/dehydratase, putative [Talaromyces stipitatus ATCC 10500]EED18317.1 NAD dependent epimerase/dehydratase, putative [Talaromyces stipitatus ATCC 10500]
MPKVLITGANGYIGNAVAKAFNRAGWKTYGLVRRAADATDLAQSEIHPIIGTPQDLSSTEEEEHCVFDVVVSNTEDWSDYEGHFRHVKATLTHIGTQTWEIAHVKTLVLFSSGYLAPHTESSPLNPVPFLRPRTESAAGLLEECIRGALPFDIVILRPTNVYGYGSSHTGSLFSWAEKSKKEGKKVLRAVADPNTILHYTHVDDCALAYLKLAEHPRRDEVKNQAFNISNARYETVRDVCEALAKSYGLSLEYEQPGSFENIVLGSVDALLQYSQWVSSEKIRQLTGWKEKRAYFSAGIAEYRMSFEAALAAKHQGTVKIYEMFQKQAA